jgi:hypothetical protein
MVVAGTTNGGNNIDLAIVTDKTTVLLGDGKGGFTQDQSYALNGTLFPIPGSNGQTDLISIYRSLEESRRPRKQSHFSG